MSDYLRAEFFKVTHRAYTYIFLALMLAGASLMVGGWVFTNAHGNHIDFASGASMLLFILPMGLYCTLLVGDMVFSDQFRHNTLKNEVSFGLPRGRIYLGKLIVSCVTAVCLCAVLMIYYLGLCRLALPGGENDLEALKAVGFCLLCALPLWLGGQALMTALYFLLKSSTVAAIAGVVIFLAAPQVWYVLACLVSDVFWALHGVMLSTPFDQMSGAVDPAFLGKTAAIGAGWFIAATVIGLIGFRRREIN